MPFENYIRRYKEIPPKEYFNIDGDIYFRSESSIKTVLDEHLDMS